MNMECKAGEVISVQSAMYGRKKAKVCPGANHDNIKCKGNSNSLQKVQSKCNGRRTCAVTASNGFFGDPCRGTFKYLQVSYSCGKPGK